MDDTISTDGDRKIGQIARLSSTGEYGFIACSDFPDQDLYFKSSWFHDSPAPRAGESVTFEVKTYDDKLQAHYVRRASTGTQAVAPPIHNRKAPTGYHIYDWAYLGHMPNVLAELQGLALNERWEFMNGAPNPEYPLPILYSYLIHTFGRLVHEHKVVVSENGSWAASPLLSPSVGSALLRQCGRTAIRHEDGSAPTGLATHHH